MSSILDKIDMFLNEAKIDDILNKKANLSDEDKTRIRELNDRLTNKTKYINYLVKYFNEKDIVELIEEFDKKFQRLEKKDINQYSIEDLRQALKLAGKSRTEQKSEGAKKIFENDKCSVYKIIDRNASCFYGSGTKWCITAKEQNMFDYYDKDNHIYFLLPKENPENKFAITAGTKKLVVYNAEDNTVPFKTIEKYGVTEETFQKPSSDELLDKIISKWTKNEDGTYSYDDDVTITKEMLVPA